jgi:proteic killer suppression protein
MVPDTGPSQKRKKSITGSGKFASGQGKYPLQRPARNRMVSLDAIRFFMIDVTMKIRNVINKGLRRFVENDDASGLQAAVVVKIRRMVSFLQDMEKEDELRAVPSWKAHLLTGDRKGTWSLFITKNWRMTFRINNDEIEIIDLDYEDYH